MTLYGKPRPVTTSHIDNASDSIGLPAEDPHDIDNAIRRHEAAIEDLKRMKQNLRDNKLKPLLAGLKVSELRRLAFLANLEADDDERDDEDDA